MDRALLWSRSARVTWWVDLGVCVTVLVVGVAGQVAVRAGAAVDSAPLTPVAVLFAGLASAALWWRRARPFATLGALFVIVVVAAGAVPPGLFGVQVALAFVAACFALGAWSDRRWAVLAVAAGLIALSVLGAAGNGSGVLPATAVALTLVALPIVAGIAARARRRELEEVERRLAESERRQDERAQLAIQDERTRIARELHDVVAHHVSLIGVQAGAARASLGSSPDATRDALASIEQSSRVAVGEMRQIVDVLQPADAAARSPQPGLADLASLVDRWHDAGYAVAIDVDDAAAADLPATMSLSCYRVVEEALTNVARHSQARSVVVAVRRGPEGVEVAVRDPGPVHADSSTVSGGRGLVGMAERSAIFGGATLAGPTPDGGFAILVTFRTDAERAGASGELR